MTGTVQRHSLHVFFKSIDDPRTRKGRHGHKSILIASQIPVENWPRAIGQTMTADTLNRIVHPRLSHRS